MSADSSDATEPEIITREENGVLTVIFNRPQQRNAMTWRMYEGLGEACARADAEESIRVLVLRGAGGKAFVAGTDIAQFRSFDGPRGVQYERQIGEVLRRLQAVDVPVVAAIEGHCVGGGLGIAASADLRICTPEARFAVPVARTLGNCLSVDTLALLSDLLGQPRVVDLILRARSIGADEALAAGFVGTVSDDLDGTLTEWTSTLLEHAPLTMWALKEGIRRLRSGSSEDTDIVDRVYGSQDFHNAVEAFLSKTPYSWTGR